MFTEEICKRIADDCGSIIAPCMVNNGLYICQKDDGKYNLRLVASDHFDCHGMLFNTMYPIVKILNAIEADFDKWKVYDGNYYGEPECCADGLWKVPEYLTLSEYLKRNPS